MTTTPTPAEQFRAVVESAGFTIEGLPTTLTSKQAFNLATRLMIATHEVRPEVQR